ncbi:MAG TPA: DUF2065 domain-containing protein [Nevskiaceae bacterium]|nr:DUF2065 domain-containing protein [Nevskiaceae bacterium]
MPIWIDLLRALALVLVLEGILPFAVPARWREAILRVASLNDRLLRLIGVTSMTIGLVILQVIRARQ